MENNKIVTNKILCSDCFGDGIETCHNPDHGFFSLISAAVSANESACPCCGHDPHHKMKGKCETCNGTGRVTKSQYDTYLKEFPPDDIDGINYYCLKNYKL